MNRSIVLAAIAAVTGSAAAQSPTGALICVENESGYVVRATLEGRMTRSGDWLRASQSSFGALDRICIRFPTDIRSIRVTVEGHTGFGWRRACQHEFAGTESRIVKAQGTSLHQRCDVF